MAQHGELEIEAKVAARVAFGPFVLDRAGGLLLLGGTEVELPQRSLRLLEVLVNSAGETVSKDRLVAEVWQGSFVSDTSLTEAMSRLRRALGTDAREQLYVSTVHRRGYRFVEPVEPMVPPHARATPRAGWWRFSIAASLTFLGLLGMLWAFDVAPVSRRLAPAPKAKAVDARYRLAEVTLDGTRLVEYGVPSLPLNGFSVDSTGSRVAFSMANGEGSDAWVFEPERGELRRITKGGRFLDPVWRRDGKALALAEHRGGDFDLVLKQVDHEGPPQVLLEASLDQFPESWSGDGSSLVFSQRHPETGYDLWLLRQRVDASWQPVPLVETPDDEAFGAISPDGRYVAYTSMGGRRAEVFVVDLMSERAPVRVSQTGGSYPFWSVAGDLLHYVDGDTLLTVPTAELWGGAIRALRRSRPVAGLYLAGSTSTANRIVVAMLDGASSGPR